jgi:hypothetical protein
MSESKGVLAVSPSHLEMFQKVSSQLLTLVSAGSVLAPESGGQNDADNFE